MRRILVLGSVLLLSSCGSSNYLASEYTSRSIIAGKPTAKVVEAPLKTQATTQLGTSITVSLVGGALLNKWANSIHKEYTSGEKLSSQHSVNLP